MAHTTKDQLIACLFRPFFQPGTMHNRSQFSTKMYFYMYPFTMNVSIITGSFHLTDFLQKKKFRQTQRNLAHDFTQAIVSVFRKLREMAILPAILLLLRCQISNKFVMITLAKTQGSTRNCMRKCLNLTVLKADKKNKITTTTKALF